MLTPNAEKRFHFKAMPLRVLEEAQMDLSREVNRGKIISFQILGQQMQLFNEVLQ